MSAYETAKARVEAGDFSFEAMAAPTVAHGELLVATDHLDRSAKVESLEPQLFAHNGAGLSVVLTWDRAGRDFCACVFDYRTVGRTYDAARGWERKPRVIDWSRFVGGEAA